MAMTVMRQGTVTTTTHNGNVTKHYELVRVEKAMSEATVWTVHADGRYLVANIQRIRWAVIAIALCMGSGATLAEERVQVFGAAGATEARPFCRMV